MPLAKGGSVDDVERELKGKLLPAMTVNWMYWTPAQFVNFYFVPQRYQGESRTWTITAVAPEEGESTAMSPLRAHTHYTTLRITP